MAKLDRSAISINEVSKSFGPHLAVNQLSLSVPYGQVYGFLGPNGAGKTTTLRMISGILQPDTGEIKVLHGQTPINSRSHLGYLPEEKGLYKDMKVVDLVAYFGTLRGLSRRQALSTAQKRLKEAGLDQWTLARCNTLSKGMGQKVQVIASLLHDPELVILDEPFSGLDPVNAEMVLNIIKGYRNAGRTIIFSTHVVEHAEQICDSVAIIHKGRLATSGSVKELRRNTAQSVIVDYDGRLDLSEIDGVRSISDSGHHVEMQLDGNADIRLILHKLTDQVTVRRFDTKEATLKQVFLDTVGKT